MKDRSFESACAGCPAVEYFLGQAECFDRHAEEARTEALGAPAVNGSFAPGAEVIDLRTRERVSDPGADFFKAAQEFYQTETLEKIKTAVERTTIWRTRAARARLDAVEVKANCEGFSRAKAHARQKLGQKACGSSCAAATYALYAGREAGHNSDKSS